MSRQRTEDQIAIVGAGPAGLAMAQCLGELGIPFQGFEAHVAPGGQWQPSNPRSRVYPGMRMVTSKARTAFPALAMPTETPDYPDPAAALRYLEAYVQRFELHRHFRFHALVRRIEPVSERADSLWRVTVDHGQGPETAAFRGVVIANGIHGEPRLPRLPGHFEGELMHAGAYREPATLAGHRVLVIGAGNSAADLAVEAARVATSVQMSVRRGVHVWPRFLEGRPSDQARAWWQRLPRPLRLRAATRQIQRAAGHPEQHGFPAAEHALDELPPVINDALLPAIAAGAIGVRPAVARMEGRQVHFEDGSQGEFDLVVAATGYKLHYPFVRPEYLNWHGAAPRLHYNMFTPHYRGLAVLGLLEGHGIGWSDLHLQATLAAQVFAAQTRQPARAEAFEALLRGPRPDLRGGRRPPRPARLAHGVHAETFRSVMERALEVVCT